MDAHRKARHLLLGGLLLLAFLVSLKGVHSYDFWGHLKAGLWILDHGSLPQKEPFTEVGRGKPYINAYPLFQVGLALFHRAGGLRGAAVYRALWVLLLLTLAYQLLRKQGLGPWTSAGLLILAFPVLESRTLLIRPHLLSYTLMAFLMLLLDRKRLGRKHFFLLFLTGFLWANGHGTYALMGLLILAAFASETLWPMLRWPLGRMIRTPQTRTVALAALALLLGLSLTPYGPRTVLLPLTHRISPEIGKAIQELAPVPLSALLSLSPGPFLQARLLFFGGLLGLLTRRVRLPYALLFLVGVGLLLRGSRFAGDFALFSLVPAAVLIREARPARLLLFPLALALGAGFLLQNLQALGQGHFASVYLPNYPMGTIRYLRAHPEFRGGLLLNEPSFGHFFVYHLVPDLRVYADMRVPGATSEEDFWVLRHLSNREVLRKLIGQAHPDLVYLSRAQRKEARNLQALGYHPLYFDNTGVLFGKGPGLRFFNPYRGNLTPILEMRDRDSLQGMERELAAVFAVDSSNYRAGSFLAAVRIALGDLEGAAAVLGTLDRSPFWHREPTLAYLYAELFLRQGALRRALRWAEEATRRQPDFLLAWKQVGRLAWELGDLPRAEQALQKALGIAGDRADRELYGLLGLVLKERGNYPEAVRFLQRVVWQSPEEELPAALNNLGGAYLEWGRWAEAEALFQEVRRQAPDSPEAAFNLFLTYREMGDTLRARALADTLYRKGPAFLSILWPRFLQEAGAFLPPKADLP